VRNHFKRYRTEGLAGLNRVGEGVGGSPSLLTEEQLIETDYPTFFNERII